MAPEQRLLLPPCQQPSTCRITGKTPHPEDMDSADPAPALYNGSSTDRGMWAAQSPGLSSTKAPLYKKQHWDAPEKAQNQESDHE